MSAHDREDGYADFAPIGKPGRPRRGWEHPATELAVRRAAEALKGASDLLALAMQPHGAHELARIDLENAKANAEAAVRELALAVAGEKRMGSLDR